MVMPNIGAFIAWGFLTALFIPTGWMPNEYLGKLVGPTLKYLMPLLIAYTGGTMVYERRGGVIGAIATIGIIIGADMTMLAGGMVMGPFAAYLMKQVDKLFEGKVKPGLEMLVDNFSMGILGTILMLLGYVVVEPIFNAILVFLTNGVQYLVNANILPFTSIFVQPADVLFLNNVINHGILVPLGVSEAAQTGKSILFLVEANGSVWVGVALAFMFFGKGMAKKSAPAAALIMFFGGIAEVVFPYILSKPKTVLGPIAGNIAALFTLSILGGGTVAAVSPGSFLALLAMTPKGGFIANIAGYIVGLVVTFAVTGLLLMRDKVSEDEDKENSDVNEGTLENPDMPKVPNNMTIKNILFACDAGMGSSVMGVSKMKTKLSKAMLDIKVTHSAVKDIPANVDLIVTTKALEERVKDTISKYSRDIPVFSMGNLLNDKEYDMLIKQIINGSKEEKPIFSKENILLKKACKDKWDAIRMCGGILVEQGYVASKYVDDMIAREKTASVYVGNNLAIPHGRADSEKYIYHSGLSFLQVPQGVKFGDETAYIIIGIAGKNGNHIQLLSSIAEVCTDMNNVNILKNTNNIDEIISILYNAKIIDNSK